MLALRRAQSLNLRSLVRGSDGCGLSCVLEVRSYQTDEQIARAANMIPIHDVASKLGIPPDVLEPYGKYKATPAANTLVTNQAVGPAGQAPGE